MNRGITGALWAIGIGSFCTFWGIVVYLLFQAGLWQIAIVPTVVLVLVAVGLINKVLTLSPPATPRTCPDCAEVVQLAAKVCKHCGLRFDEVDGTGTTRTSSNHQ